MALKPNEVLRPRLKSPEHSKKKIFEIVNAIEDIIDTALERLKRNTCRQDYDGTISIGVVLKGARITPGAIAEVTRRYLKTEENPDGWGSFSIETLGEYIAVTLNERTEEEIIAANPLLPTSLR